MTTTLNAAGLLSPRSMYQAPPDVRQDAGGPWCPLDDTELWFASSNWYCLTCEAEWDAHGRNGCWPPVIDDEPQMVLTEAGMQILLQAERPLLVEHGGDDVQVVAMARLRRLDRRIATVIGLSVIGALGYGAGRASHSWELPVSDAVLWTFAGVLTAATVVYVAVAVLQRWLELRRYAGNELVDSHELTAGPGAGGEVSDVQ